MSNGQATEQDETKPASGNPRRPRRGSYKPMPESLALLKVSGNPINGLGETALRRPSPFFWHPPDQHPMGNCKRWRAQARGNAQVLRRHL